MPGSRTLADCLRPAVGVVAAVALLLTPAAARAAITVNTTADNPPSGTACLGAPGDCSVRQAIDKAAVVDTLVVPAGTYLLTTGGITVAKSLTIQGAGARNTIVSGNGTSLVFQVNSGITTISGMKLTGGNRVGAGGLVQGGAIRNEAGATLNLEAVSVSDTTLDTTGAAGGVARGGGIANFGTLTVANSTIAGNTERSTGATGALFGAGLFNSGGTVTITNSTMAANSQTATAGATASGAAIRSNFGTITLRSTTIAGNAGSAMIDATTATVSVKNTIVANGPSGNCTGALASQGHNLDGADQCGFRAAGDRVNANPLLGPLTGNGGPTDTAALLAGSPAIDSGDPADCPPADQRGIARPQQTGCDIGAFEYTDERAPVASSLRVRPTAFAALRRGASVVARKKRRGARVTYTLSEDATVTFTVERARKGRKRKGSKCSTRIRKGRRCTTYKKVSGRFTHAGRKGRNSLRFSGRLGSRKLRLGRYRLVAVPSDAAGNRGKATRKAFRIKR